MTFVLVVVLYADKIKITRTITYNFKLMIITLADYSGAIFSLTTTILYAKNNIWAWPICIITNLINLYLFYSTGIFADAALEIVYLSLAFYGIWNWLYGGTNQKQLEISNVKAQESLLLLVFLIIGYFLVHYILSNHTSSTVAKLDSLAMVLSLVGQWLMCRKYFETWVVWFVADIVLATMFYYKGLTAHLILNIIYIPMSFYGYMSWIKINSKIKSKNNVGPYNQPIAEH